MFKKKKVSCGYHLKMRHIWLKKLNDNSPAGSVGAGGCDVAAVSGALWRQERQGGEAGGGLQVDKVGNMRSVVGLIAVVAIASLYLYSLSLYLPAAPRRRPPHPSAETEHVDAAESERLPDGPEEPSRWLALT